jgi:hypothetical protein
LVKTEAQNVMYGVLATLVNIPISYDKQEINHEMCYLSYIILSNITFCGDTSWMRRILLRIWSIARY